MHRTAPNGAHTDRSLERSVARRPGPHGALPRPVQLQLLARRVWRRVPAASAQRGLPAPDLRPTTCSTRPKAAAWPRAIGRGSSSRRTTTTSTAGRKCAWPATGWWRWSSPAQGGQLYELDVRAICHNLLATLTRREEAYHETVRAGESAASGDVASIHDRVVFKQAGPRPAAAIRPLPPQEPRRSFLSARRDARGGRRGHLRGAGRFRRRPVRSQAAPQPGPHAGAAHARRPRRRAARCGSPRASRSKRAARRSRLRTCSKACRPARRSTSASSSTSPACRPAATIATSTTRDGNVARPARHAARSGGRRLRSASPTSGSASTSSCKIDRPSALWTFPIETVSQSEAGFELVHQSVVVQPHWFVEADARRPLERADSPVDRHGGRRSAPPDDGKHRRRRIVAAAVVAFYWALSWADPGPTDFFYILGEILPRIRGRARLIL